MQDEARNYWMPGEDDECAECRAKDREIAELKAEIERLEDDPRLSRLREMVLALAQNINATIADLGAEVDTLEQEMFGTLE